jgi:hypothetical protein
LRPPIAAEPRLVQLSKNGCGSPMTVPGPWLAGVPGLLFVELIVGQAGALMADEDAQTAPKVFPLTRFKAPGEEGPYPVLNELSLIANPCA